MKRKSHFKIVVVIVLTFATLLTILSCKSKGTIDTQNLAQVYSEARIYNFQKEQDEQFIMKAASINLREIKLGQLAQIKSTVSDVGVLGKMIEETHLKAIRALNTIAKKKLLTLPTTTSALVLTTFKKLSKKVMGEFDKEYCNLIVNQQENMIVFFEKISTESSDYDVRLWARNVLPDLMAQYEYAIFCSEKLEKI